MIIFFKVLFFHFALSQVIHELCGASSYSLGGGPVTPGRLGNCPQAGTPRLPAPRCLFSLLLFRVLKMQLK